eukprot:gene586-2005_t
MTSTDMSKHMLPPGIGGLLTDLVPGSLAYSPTLIHGDHFSFNSKIGQGLSVEERKCGAVGLQISALTFHLGCIQHAFKHNSISCQTDDGVQGNAIAARDRATRVWTDDDGIFQLSNY